MTDISVELAQIALYTDIAKIGIPALAGILVGLIPYFLERKKLSASNLKEQRIFYQSQVIELIECFSDFSGSYFRYLSFIIATQKGTLQDDKMIKETFSAGNELLKSEMRLKKARAIAALIGNTQLVQSLDDFDTESQKTLTKMNKSPRMDSKEIITLVKNKEKIVLSNLNSILNLERK